MNHNHTSISNDTIHGMHPHSMMQITFHTNFHETILFDSWHAASVPIFVGSCVFIFILGILYEGIRGLRQCLVEERLNKKPRNPDDGNENELECMNTESPELPKSPVHIKEKIPPQYAEHALQSLLYTAQLALVYMLMLIVMTYNVYLFLAVIFGIGTGYFLFTWIGITPSTNNNQRHT